MSKKDNVMEQIPLSNPPSYEYKTKGPFWVTQMAPSGKTEAWMMHTLDLAVLRFWFAKTTPLRRVMVDVYGVTVCGADSSDPELPRMCGTRETMDVTLKLVEKADNDLANQAETLAMIDRVRQCDGQAF